jgi:hypothetical protein
MTKSVSVDNKIRIDQNGSSYVEAFAIGGYTIDPNDSIVDKIRVVATWFFSIITAGLFPATAFLACFIKDLVDVFTPDIKFDLNFDDQYPTNDSTNLCTSKLGGKNQSYEEMPNNSVAKTASEVDNFSGEKNNRSFELIQYAMKTLAEGDSFAIAKLLTIQNELEKVSPFCYLTTVLSNENTTNHLGKLATRTEVWVFWKPFDLFAEFYKGIDSKRKVMGENKWKTQINEFEKFCEVQEGTFSKLTTTKEFVESVIKMRDTLHRTILNKKK